MFTASPPRPASARSIPALDDAEQLTLPAAWTPPPRRPLPLAASAVPVVGAVVLWLVTGSMLALLLAGLGPLIAVATTLDAARGVRRDRRRAEADAVAARTRVAAAVERLHDEERARRRARHPDVAESLARDAVWRGRVDGPLAIAVGSGDVPSGLRVSGGEGDEETAALRAAAARLTHVPIVVPVQGVLAVAGAGAAADAAHRALVVQACLAAPPGELAVVGAAVGAEAWSAPLPHRRGGGSATLAIEARAGAPLPDAAIVRLAPGEPLPAGCRAVLTVDDPSRARLDVDGEVVEIAVETLAAAQAEAVARALAARAEATGHGVSERAEPVDLGALLAQAGARPVGDLGAAIGTDADGIATVDLVADGPHAVVAGVTGSGKSELLITWIASLAATRSTDEVTFLLADFKGGTAFDALAAVPHVTGVITDLDGAGARRAIESLRAEVRWREAQLAQSGARDIRDPRAGMPRLVVVVDEFAALLGDHPELHAVFADVAARGRALGMHLVLGTQRASGVIRDNLLANCPLRISLRVTDRADSRAVLGVDDAAEIPGGASGRGTALVRRAGDAAPRRTRVALAAPATLRALAERPAGPAPRRPWLPGLPAAVTLADLETGARGDGPRDAGMLLLGLADEPEQQRQRAVGVRVSDRGLLVAGGAGSGRSTALRTLAAQAPGAVVRVPASAEAAWDAVHDLAGGRPAPGTVVVIDDLDALVGRFPADHAHELVERLERVLRGAGDAGILVLASAQRLSGPVGRLAELLPHRLVLATRSRAEHLALGGEPDAYAPDAPPGRGAWRGAPVQVALTPRAVPPSGAPAAQDWFPDGPLTGIVTRRPPTTRDALEAWAGRGIRPLTLDEYVADPTVTADAPIVLVGDPDDWQRHWRLLAAARADHDLVVDTSCAADYRIVTGSRATPPYAEAGAGRAWLVHAGADPVRIVLPARDLRADRPAAPA